MYSFLYTKDGMTSSTLTRQNKSTFSDVFTPYIQLNSSECALHSYQNKSRQGPVIGLF